jgi:hypothetical protein
VEKRRQLDFIIRVGSIKFVINYWQPARFFFAYNKREAKQRILRLIINVALHEQLQNAFNNV